MDTHEDIDAQYQEATRKLKLLERSEPASISAGTAELPPALASDVIVADAMENRAADAAIEHVLRRFREALQNHKFPKGWKQTNTWPSGAAWTDGRLIVKSEILMVSEECWQTATVFHAKRPPMTAEIHYVKRHWFGDDLHAYVYMPRRKEGEPILAKPNTVYIASCLSYQPVPVDWLFEEFRK
jgi:hypothetical protein